MEEARVIINDSECYFQQGDVQFNVDRTDVWKVIGAGSYKNDGSVIDHLTDSMLMQFARANDLDVTPYSRSLLCNRTYPGSPLNGVIMIAWLRDVSEYRKQQLKAAETLGIKTYEPIFNFDLDKLLRTQAERVAAYSRRIEELRHSHHEISEDEDLQSSRKFRWIRTYRIAPGSAKKIYREAGGLKMCLISARDLAVYEIVRDLKECTFAQILEEARTRIKTKSKLEYVVGHFVNSLTNQGLIELINSR